MSSPDSTAPLDKRYTTEVEQGVRESRKDRLRRRLPYGIWTCADGREVLFNRGYRPIWSRVKNGVAVATPFEWVKSEKQEWFFDDGNPPWRDPATLLKCQQILGKFIAGESLSDEIDAHKARRTLR